uniref:Uroporphyrinogen III synthase HEM4 n=1 Tax=Solibacter usitatus (strain Ellin6076) TaxID=234267 RepID=Q02CL4_SOLUE
MSFADLRVLSLESRRAREMETLILREGGIPFVAPSVKERAVDDDSAAIHFVEQLEAGEFEMLICMTSVGLTLLRDTVTKQMPSERLSAALRRVTIVSRGPKPVGVLKALEVPIHLVIPEPNTWKEIVEAVASRHERRIAVQEYGRPNLEMNQALERLGCRVTPVALYRWELPDDVRPLREAAARLAAREFDVVLFTSSIQLDHLLQIARTLGLEQEVCRAMRHDVVVASIGAVMTSALIAHGRPPDVIPKHPKMWSLVKAASDEAAAVLAAKRANERRP